MSFQWSYDFLTSNLSSAIKAAYSCHRSSSISLSAYAARVLCPPQHGASARCVIFISSLFFKPFQLIGAGEHLLSLEYSQFVLPFAASAFPALAVSLMFPSYMDFSDAFYFNFCVYILQPLSFGT